MINLLVFLFSKTLLTKETLASMDNLANKEFLDT